jgi:hypothetical protein
VVRRVRKRFSQKSSKSLAVNSSASTGCRWNGSDKAMAECVDDNERMSSTSTSLIVTLNGDNKIHVIYKS